MTSASPDDDVAAALAALAERLASAEARSELRVVEVPRRAPFRGTRLRVAGRVWRLGALLLGPDGELFATGDVITAAAVGHPNFRSKLALERREMRLRLAKARIPEGETVNIAPRSLDLRSRPLRAPLAPLAAGGDDAVSVVWSPGASPTPLRAYLEERAALLLDPPRG